MLFQCDGLYTVWGPFFTDYKSLFSLAGHSTNTLWGISIMWRSQTQQALIEMIQHPQNSMMWHSEQPSSSSASHSFVNFTGEEENANCCYGSSKALAQIRAVVIVLCSLGRVSASSSLLSAADRNQPHCELQHKHLHLRRLRSRRWYEPHSMK